MAVKNLLVRGGADFSGMQKGLANAQKSLNNFQNNTGKIMKGIGATLAAIGVGKLVKDSMQASSDLEGAMVGLKSILDGQGKSFTKANSFIQGYIKDGLVPLTDAVGAYKNLAARGYDDKQIQQVMSRLKDSAAFGRQSGLSLGEAVKTATEGLKNENSVLVDNAGVTKNVAKMWDEYAKSIGTTRDKLTDQQKIQAEVNGIMQETQWQVGDAAKYTQTYAGRVAALKKTLQDVKVSLGNAFMPIANIVLPLLQALATNLLRITSIFAQFTQALFGKASNSKAQTKAVNQQLGAVNNLGDATESVGQKATKAGKAAEKASKGAVSNFDEINSLDKGSNSGEKDSGGDDLGGGIDAGGIGTMPINFETNAPDISGKVQAMANNVKTKVKEITDTIVTHKELIIATISGLAAAILTYNMPSIIASISTSFAGLGSTLGVLLSPIGLVAATVGILVGSFVYLYQTNLEFKNNINMVWEEISNTLNSFVSGTLMPIFSYIVNDFLMPIATAFKTYTLPVLADIFIGVGKILNDILKLVKSTIDNVWNIVKPGLELVKNIVTDILEDLKKLWDKYGQTLIDNIRAFIKGVQETFQLLWDKVLNPIIKPFLEMLSWLWEKHLRALVKEVGEFVMKCVNGALELYNGFIKPIVDWLTITLGPAFSTCINFIVDIFGTFIASIADFVKSLLKILGGIVDFIVGIFTGNWKKAWQGVVDVFKGIVELISGIFKGVLNCVIDVINFAVGGVVAAINGLIQGAICLINKIPGVDIQLTPIEAPKIPKLAHGGYVGANNPMMAIVGDNTQEGEIIAPESKIYEQVVKGLTDVLSVNATNNMNNTNDKPLELTIQIGTTTLGKVVIDSINKVQRQAGRTLIKI